MNDKSCVGCKFLYSQDEGYSNYTVENTSIICALGRNPNLPADEPHDWKRDADNWPATKELRCERYVYGGMVCLDVDGEETVEGQTDDAEVIAAIKASPV